MWSLPAIVLAVSVFVWLSSGRWVSTDNAYVKGDRAQIAPELSGIIVEVPVQENQHVSRGQLLFKLDDQSYRLSLAKIDAEIETTRADIRGLRAQWRTKREEIKAAQSQLNYAQQEFERQSDLAERKIASQQKLQETRMGLDVARQRISAAQEDLQRIEAQLAGDPKIRTDDHPRVKQMVAARDEALLQLRRTTIESPLDGIVSKRPVPGSYATAGVPVMVVVADTDLWIEANFKETELTLVRPGQTAIVKVDTYPDAECTGKVASIAQATGAEFAVLPPQNASGNWVKVVQRIPVRIAVTCREGDPPLARRHEHDGRDRHRPQPLDRRPLERARQDLRPVERVGHGQAMTPVDPAVRRRRGLITIVVMMATIMHALDGTIANVALPSIQGSLSATQEQVSWVVTSYIVASAIMTPFAGFSATRFGLRRTLVDLRDRLHHRVDAVRGGPDARPARAVPRPAGRLWRGAGAGLAGHHDGHLSARGAGQGDGDVGRRHHDRSDRRPVARRLADRRVHLALGVLRQPAGRPAVRRRHPDTGARHRTRSAGGRSTCWASSCSPSPSAASSSCSIAASSSTGSIRSRSSSRPWWRASPSRCS